MTGRDRSRLNRGNSSDPKARSDRSAHDVRAIQLPPPVSSFVIYKRIRFTRTALQVVRLLSAPSKIDEDRSDGR